MIAVPPTVILPPGPLSEVRHATKGAAPRSYRRDAGRERLAVPVTRVLVQKGVRR